MIHHYPLQWPPDWPRYKGLQVSGGFQVPYDQAIRELARALDKLGAETAYIATDQELRVDGSPRRDRHPGSPAAALFFERKGKQLCIPCDRFNSVRDNVRAIGLTLEDINHMERYGTSQMVEATLSGFAALPANAGNSVGPRSWHEVLQVAPDADETIIRVAYRNLASRYHPDNPHTGDEKKFLEVQRAFTEAGGTT
jgi:DnaJ domain